MGPRGNFHVDSRGIPRDPTETRGKSHGNPGKHAINVNISGPKRPPAYVAPNDTHLLFFPWQCQSQCPMLTSALTGGLVVHTRKYVPLVYGIYNGPGILLLLAVLVTRKTKFKHTSRGKISITFSDPYQKCLRKPWKFLFPFFFSPGPSTEKLLGIEPCFSLPSCRKE